MSSPSSSTTTTPVAVSFDLSQQEVGAIIDSLYRAVIGLDTNDRALFDSAWLDPATAVFQANDNAMNGLATIHANIFDKVGPLDTTHFIQNVRMTGLGNDRKSATFTTYALAQHYPAGQGPQLGLPGRKNVLSGSRYTIDAVRDDTDGLWKMTKWTMRIVWLEGDMAVITG